MPYQKHCWKGKRNKMKVFKIILICLASIAIIFGTFKLSENIIENMNSRYIPENPLVIKTNQIKQTNEDLTYPTDIDRMISRSVDGIKETTLPVKYEKNYTIYKGKLYITLNSGKTWIQVPNDDYLGYASVDEYLNTISQSNIYVSNKKIAVIYGGRGSENICIINSENQGQSWSVGSISKTANHNLQKGYNKMYIDFLNDNKTAYIVAISDKGVAQEKVHAYRSVNSGVTWDNVNNDDKLYHDIMVSFGL